MTHPTNAGDNDFVYIGIVPDNRRSIRIPFLNFRLIAIVQDLRRHQNAALIQNGDGGINIITMIANNIDSVYTCKALDDYIITDVHGNSTIPIRLNYIAACIGHHALLISLKNLLSQLEIKIVVRHINRRRAALAKHACRNTIYAILLIAVALPRNHLVDGTNIQSSSFRIITTIKDAIAVSLNIGGRNFSAYCFVHLLYAVSKAGDLQVPFNKQRTDAVNGHVCIAKRNDIIAIQHGQQIVGHSPIRPYHVFWCLFCHGAAYVAEYQHKRQYQQKYILCLLQHFSIP